MPRGGALAKIVITVDENLAVIYGKKKTVSPTELTKGVWAYIKAKKLVMKPKTGPLMKRTIEFPAEAKAVFGTKPIKIGEISKKLWAYIKAHKLRKG
uniref:DM2 domain-containing protein n=1 Tax=candidate division WOR-3 bacterium TaxID=2052148 RepID=A0A7C4CF00_UNCW3